MLVAVIFMLALLIISLAVALPKVREDIQRDRELETMHRGKQYVRAIQLYYRKFGAYPPNVDALVKTNDIRFLRKKYIDPTTGKDDWKPILFGQNKTPTAMGFFGQPLAGYGAGGHRAERRKWADAGQLERRAGSEAPVMGRSEQRKLGFHFGRQRRTAAGTDTGSAQLRDSAARCRYAGNSEWDGCERHFDQRDRFGFGDRVRPTSGQTFGGAGIIGSRRPAPSSRSWFTRRRTITTSGSFSTSPLVGPEDDDRPELRGHRAAGSGGTDGTRRNPERRHATEWRVRAGLVRAPDSSDGANGSDSSHFDVAAAVRRSPLADGPNAKRPVL